MKVKTVNDKPLSKGIVDRHRGRAGVAGIGGGTGLVAIATSLPDDSGLKQWLLYIAPSVSVLLGIIWLWAQQELSSFLERIKFKMLARRVKADMTKAIDSPVSSEEHKEILRKKMEEVDLIIANKGLDELKSTVLIERTEVKIGQEERHGRTPD